MTNPERNEEMADAIEQAELNDSPDSERPYARIAAARTPSQVYSVRIPVDRLEELRTLALERGMQPTALIRRWVLERLDGESSLGPQATVVVVHSVGRSKTNELKDGLQRIDREIASALSSNVILPPDKAGR